MGRGESIVDSVPFKKEAPTNGDGNLDFIATTGDVVRLREINTEKRVRVLLRCGRGDYTLVEGVAIWKKGEVVHLIDNDRLNESVPHPPSRERCGIAGTSLTEQSDFEG